MYFFHDNILGKSRFGLRPFCYQNFIDLLIQNHYKVAYLN